eukprot:6207435-Pleurochrysis_carterae.AAC.2
MLDQKATISETRRFSAPLPPVSSSAVGDPRPGITAWSSEPLKMTARGGEARRARRGVLLCDEGRSSDTAAKVEHARRDRVAHASAALVVRIEMELVPGVVRTAVSPPAPQHQGQIC